MYKIIFRVHFFAQWIDLRQSRRPKWSPAHCTHIV